MAQNSLQHDDGSYRQDDSRNLSGSENAVDAVERNQGAMTIADFVERVFVPEHVALKNPAGRTHYQALLKHVLMPEEVDCMFLGDAAKSGTRLKAVPNWPYLSSVRLCDARPDDVQRLILAAMAHGYSTQTVKHIRNVVSAIFEHARKKHWYTGDNPASLVTLPQMTRKDAHALTPARTQEVLGVMQYPEREMALMAILTSMNLAEICGLQWKYVNLTGTWSNTSGEPVPPRTIAVRKHLYRGELENVNKAKRNRNLPIPECLIPILRDLSRRADFTGPDDFVLVSDAGKPVIEKNIALRRLKTIGRSLQMPWLSWQVFRRTRTNLRNELGMQFLDLMMRQSESAFFVSEQHNYAASSMLSANAGTQLW